jgi:hypothetical protein
MVMKCHILPKVDCLNPTDDILDHGGLTAFKKRKSS